MPAILALLLLAGCGEKEHPQNFDPGKGKGLEDQRLKDINKGNRPEKPGKKSPGG